MQHRIRRLFAGLLATATVGFSAATADPAAPRDHQLSAETALIDACIETANAVGAAEWSCLGGELTYVTKDEPVKAEVAKVQGISNVVIPERPATASRAVGIEAGTMTIPPDAEGWCEPTGICQRYPNLYQSVTKGNLYFGYGTTYYGNFDVVLSINLNGRQPRFYVQFDWDAGPAVKFRAAQVNCVKDQTFDGNCGRHALSTDGAFSISSITPRMTQGPINNSRLTLSDDYFATITARMTPKASGVFELTMATLRSPNFNCFDTGNCYFTNA